MSVDHSEILNHDNLNSETPTQTLNSTEPTRLQAQPIPFTHLHLHTEYSLLDGANKLKDLAKRVKKLGMSSVAMSDHGNMFGAIEFYKVMKKEGIKPIIGIEAYIHNDEKLSSRGDEINKFHVCLYAKNDVGYKNLMYLSSQSFIEGFYRTSRINKKILRERSEGLVCSSACLNGEVAWHLNLNPRMNAQRRNKKIQRGARGYEGALESALEYKDIFGEDFYIEIMRHGVDDQLFIDEALIRLSLETGIKLIATNDSHYNKKEDADMQEAAMMIAMGKKESDKDRLRHTVSEFYIKSPEQMLDLFRDIPDAVFNTQEIANKCNLEIDLKDEKNPPTPPSFRFTKECAKAEGLDISEDSKYFAYKCRQGLEKRLENIESSKHEKYKHRLEYEIDIITQMRFCGYMLIVWDFINFAKNNGIPVGPGRGSAAGSLVAFCLGITDIDPIRYDLLFERFLNPARVSMPDIDTDFCQKKRGEVFDYMIKKYGKYNVAQVITFGKMLAKGVIRDVARIYDMPLKDADKFAKLIPQKLGITLQGYKDKNGEYVKGAYDLEPKIKDFIESSPLAKRVWDMALKLENLNRNAGKHAAALVLDSKNELWHKTPLYVSEKTKGAVVTQYSMKYLEAIDLIKFDFLGLKTLSVINDAIKNIKDSTGIDIDFSKIDVDDDKTYQTLRSGNTLGIFQLESSGMQEINRRLQPSNIDETIALIALFRPGPMESGMTDSYIERKHGRQRVSHMFKELEPILKSTYGVIVYQEQVMQIVQVIGGFSLGEADLIRRAMGKKDSKIMQESREKFSIGAESRGFNKTKAQELFDLIAKFAEYGFNKAHSAAYGILVFQTSYLKTYFKHEFMAAMLTSESNKIESVAKYIDEVKAMGIEILPPHVNTSKINFSVLTDKSGNKKIVFGLGALKGAGEVAMQSIIDNRLQNGEFQNLDDFVSRIDFSRITKKALEPLIKSGSLDNLGYTRASMLGNLDYICESGRSLSGKKVADKKSASKNGAGLFGAEIIRANLNMENLPELANKHLLEGEQESVGLYFSGHPLDEFKAEISEIKNAVKILELEELSDESDIFIIIKVQDIDIKISKNNRQYGILKAMDFSSKINITIFENHIQLLESMDLDKPVGILGWLEKDMIQEEDSISYKVNIKIKQILPFEACKSVKVRAKRDKGYDSGHEDSRIHSIHDCERNVSRGGFSSKVEYRVDSSSANDIFDTEVFGVNGVESLDLRADMNDRDSCLCVLFESMIREDEIETLMNIAKQNSGNTKLAIGFIKSESKQAFILESDINVSSSIRAKLERIFPSAVYQVV